MAGLLWYRSYMDSLANTNGYYPDIHAGHADRVTELPLDAPYLIRETPAGYNQLELMELVGGTVAWNQIMPKTTSVSGSVSGVTATVDGDGFVTVTGTASATGIITISPGPTGNTPANHVLLITAWGKGDVRVGRSGFGAGGNNYVFSKHTADFYVGAYFYIESGKTYDCKKKVCCHDLTQMFGSEIADYVYNLEQSTTGSGIAWLQSYGFFTEDNIPYSAATLQSVEATAHVTKDANNTTIATYPLDSDLVLRGIPKLTNGVLSYDGDTYEWDGTVTRKYGKRAYQAGDESLTDAITDGTDTVYKLAVPTTESADPFTAVQTVEEGGTEEFVTGNNVPVGNVSVYRRA